MTKRVLAYVAAEQRTILYDEREGKGESVGEVGEIVRVVHPGNLAEGVIVAIDDEPCGPVFIPTKIDTRAQ